MQSFEESYDLDDETISLNIDEAFIKIISHL
jgi:hypothetical protein